MGIFKKIFNQPSLNKEFIEIVRATDKGDEQASKKLSQIAQRARNNGTLDDYINNVHNARIAIYTAPAKNGDEEAQYWLGYSLQDSNPTESYKWLYSLAQKGNIKAMKALSQGYSKYGGYGENEEKELYWDLQAAQAGDAEAQCDVALDYLAKGDRINAYEWYKKSADQKCIKGMLGLADYYEKDCLFPNYPLNDEEQKIRSLCYDEAEKLYAEVVDSECTIMEAAKAFHGIGQIYSKSCVSIVESRDVAVYHYYQSYLLYQDIGEDRWADLEMQAIQRTIKNYNLNIPQSKFEYWKNNGYDPNM